MTDFTKRDLETAEDKALTLDDVQPTFSFDLKLFHKRLDIGDNWQQVIQGHLFLDHVLTTTLVEALKHPGKISLERMSFTAKLDLALALGLVQEELAAILKGINRIRNKIAHNLSYSVTEEHVGKIYDAAPKVIKELVEYEIAQPRCKLSKLCVFLKATVIIADSNPQMWANYREKERERVEALNDAIRNAKKVLDEHDGADITRGKGD